jgi:hypothetical protein
LTLQSFYLILSYKYHLQMRIEVLSQAYKYGIQDWAKYWTLHRSEHEVKQTWLNAVFTQYDLSCNHSSNSIGLTMSEGRPIILSLFNNFILTISNAELRSSHKSKFVIVKGSCNHRL